MHSLIIASIICLFLQEENKKQHLPIEIFFSPIKTKNKISDSSFDNNVIQRKNEEFQLKIHSNDDSESKADLIIEATKEIQATEKSIDMYSPKYNGEKNIPNGDSDSTARDSVTSGKAIETSRKDPNSLYQPSNLSEKDLFSSTQKFIDIPQQFLYNRNKYSPLENLKHLEKNLEKEMKPRYLEQALTTLQYMNSEIPYGMMLPQPMFAGGYAQMLHPDPKPNVLNHMQNPPGHYDPHQRQIPSNTPIYNHHVENGNPQSNSAINPYYGYMNPIYQPQFYPNPQQQINIKEISRDPRYNSESGYKTISSPEQNTLLQTSAKPEYNTGYNPQYHPMSRHKELASLNDYPESNSQSHHLPHSHRIQTEHSDSQRPVRDEVHDRNLYYTPLPDKYQKFELKTPAYISDMLQIPIDNQQLPRTRIIPQIDHDESMHPNAMNGLRSPSPINYPRNQQVPRYTIVPQNLLPKYLQTPVYRPYSSGSDTESHQLSAERAKLQHHPHPYDEERYRSPQVHSDPRHKLEMKHLDSPPEHSLSPVYRRYPNQMSSVPPHYVNSKETQKDYSGPSRPVQRLIPQKDSSLYSYPIRDQKEYPISSVPVYHAKSQDSQTRYPEPSHHLQKHNDYGKSEDHSTNNENKQSSPKRRKKYKSSKFENESVPYKRNQLKGLQSQSNDNTGDLNSYASHQYVIKIG